jgi:hypothetical protein
MKGKTNAFLHVILQNPSPALDPHARRTQKKQMVFLGSYIPPPTIASGVLLAPELCVIVNAT